jgi:aspartate aminotransferase
MSAPSSDQNNSSRLDTPAQRLRQINNQLDMSSNGVASAFGAVQQAPEDPLFGLMAAYRADKDPKKVDLGIGAYRDNNAVPWILPVVKKVRLPHDSVLHHARLTLLPTGR